MPSPSLEQWRPGRSAAMNMLKSQVTSMKKKTKKSSPKMPTLSLPALDELQTQIYRVESSASVHRMWDRLFTAPERRRLGGDLAKAWSRLGTTGMWAEVHRVSVDEAVLEVALILRHLSQTDYDWLRREMGLPSGPTTGGSKSSAPANHPKTVSGARTKDARQAASAPQAPAVPKKPAWTKATGKATGQLRYGGRLIRTFRLMGRPANIQQIVEAFEERGWPQRIDNPLPGIADDPDRLRQALQSLNDGLVRIRFHAQEGGRAIGWAPNS